MATSAPTRLDVTGRVPGHSRSVRRMRRAGLVPGVLYGGDGDPIAFAVDRRVLRTALAARGAVLNLSIDGEAPTPAVLKDTQRDPVRGETMHVDLVRVRLDRPIEALVSIELTGGDDAPGVREGGVLEQLAHEVLVAALPTAIPESIVHDISSMAIGDRLTLAELDTPAGVTLLGELEETVVATVSQARLRLEGEDEIETETEVVGQPSAAAHSESDGDDAVGDADASQDAADDSE
jgi:large subunit ribosomal protein L25